MRAGHSRRRLLLHAGSAFVALGALSACSGPDGIGQTLPAAGSPAYARSASVAPAFGVADAMSGSRSFAPLTLTWPQGAPNGGDLLVACAESQYAQTPQTPAGWTSLYSASANRFGTALFYKLAGAAEPAAVVFTIPTPCNISATMVRITGAASSVPLWSHTTSSGTVAPATQAIVPSVAGMLPIACFGGVNASSYAVAGGWSLAAQAAGGYATMIEQRQTVSADASTGISVSSVASTTSARTSNDSYGLLIAPAKAAATPGPATLTIEDTNSASVSAGPLKLAWPNGAPTSGDLLVACAESQYQATPTTPAGWTSLFAASAGRFGTGLFYRIAGPSEPASVVFAIPVPYNISAAMIRIAGAAAAAPLWSHVAQAGAATVTTPGIIPAANASLPLACFAGVNATSYTIANGWNLTTQSRGGYTTTIEARQSAATDTSTPISVAATASKASASTFTDAYGLIVAPASTTGSGGLSVDPASIAFNGVAAPAQTVSATQTGTAVFRATSLDCTKIATIASIGTGRFTVAPVGVGACTFTISGSGGASVPLAVTTTSTVISVH